MLYRLVPVYLGVAVIRISGSETKNILKKLTNNNLPRPRVATLKKINKINKMILLMRV